MSKSHVEILCASKVYEKLHAVMKKHNMKPDDIRKVPDCNVYFIAFDDIRWSTSYPEIQDFMNVLYDSEDKISDDYHYSFIRLGDEERDDIEDFCYHDYEYPFDEHHVYITTCKPSLEEIDELI